MFSQVGSLLGFPNIVRHPYKKGPARDPNLENCPEAVRFPERPPHIYAWLCCNMPQQTLYNPSKALTEGHYSSPYPDPKEPNFPSTHI